MVIQLVVRLDEQGADAARLDGLRRELRQDLLQLDVESVCAASLVGDLPPGARGVDAETVNELVVAVVAAAPLVESVGRAVAAWVSRRGARTAELSLGDRTIRVEGSSREQQDRLIAMFAQELERTEP